MNIDYLIVGSGLTGSTIGRYLHDQGYKVLIIDRRSHLGGNVYDHNHPSGIRIHTYGPHYFRTISEEIWEFVNRFAYFYKYEASLLSYIDGKYENWPITGSYIKREIGENWTPSFSGKPTNLEEAALSLMPEKVYFKFIKEYNIKQWGIQPKFLSPDLVNRFDIRIDDDPRLTPNHKYQGLPRDGYSNFLQNMLKGIPVLLNVDYLKNRSNFSFNKKIIFTGLIDEFFDFKFGKLKYRGQQRIHEYVPNVDFAQPCGQVNNPLLINGPHIRTLEWKHMMEPNMSKCIQGTILTQEIPISPNNPEDCEYPYPDNENKALYERYKKELDKHPDTIICGRLGEYKYYDMDKAIGNALVISKKIHEERQDN